MTRIILIVAASMGLAACLPAYVAVQQPDSAVSVAGEQGSVAPAKPAAAVKLMNCKPYAPGGAQADEDSFVRCQLVNERTQAIADAKAARDELARFKAEAPAPRPPSGQAMFVQPPPMVPPTLFGASTSQPADMTGVVHVFGMQGVAGSSARVCVFRGGAPISVEVGGRFVPTLADVDGDNRVDGVYDCAPAIAGNLYISDVQPGASAELVYVVAASRRPMEYRGMVYPAGHFVKSRGCRVYGYLQNSEAAATLCNHF